MTLCARPFSVIVPCYNGEATLGACLESLRGQDGLREILLVDDGSSDGSAALAEARGCRVVRHGENRGSAAARNTGARLSGGEVLIFIDTDVVTPPGTLARLRAQLEAHPEVHAVNGTYTWDYSLPSRFGRFFNALMCVEMALCPIVIATSFCAVRREAFERCGGFDERIDSAYADDITFGWVFTNRGFTARQFADIQCQHLKTMTGRQWVRHSYKHGRYWTESFVKNFSETSQLGTQAVTSGFRAWNIALAALTLPALLTPLGPLVAPASGVAFLLNNRLILQAFLKRDGLRFALFGAAALAGESIFYLAGASRGLLGVPPYLRRQYARQ